MYKELTLYIVLLMNIKFEYSIIESLIKYDRLPDELWQYIGANTTVSRNKYDRISERIRPYLGENVTVPWNKYDRTLKRVDWLGEK